MPRCLYIYTVNPRRRGRHSDRGSRGSHACQHSTSPSQICVSRFIVIFMVSANDLAVTWATWKLTASAPPLDLRPLWRPCRLLLFASF
ncbi:hypothetical protein Y032_0336g2878 [Ancylostoma ceylanicum]|uniref:Uncharacterized protein n=1 Tax=Ancylostoma ceylanicum TaxID=53326 RepID=A0A016RYC1_9BILA|nr:hypothetical protein Y032_0336g2878 [Ancylostoma ceylanicum]